MEYIVKVFTDGYLPITIDQSPELTRQEAIEWADFHGEDHIVVERDKFWNEKIIHIVGRDENY